MRGVRKRSAPGRGAFKRKVRARIMAQRRGRVAIMNGELKFHDVDLDDSTISTTGTVTASINLIPQGVTEITRVGRKCTLRSIMWRYDVSLAEVDAQPTAVSGDIVRMILFIDKQANGATATVLDILKSTDYQSFNNLNNSGRFRTLMDKSIALNYLTLGSDGGGVVSSAEIIRQGTFFKKINLPVEFSAATGAITEIRSNNIGVLLISRNGIGIFNSKFRVRFSDR